MVKERGCTFSVLQTVPPPAALCPTFSLESHTPLDVPLFSYLNRRTWKDSQINSTGKAGTHCPDNTPNTTFSHVALLPQASAACPGKANDLPPHTSTRITIHTPPSSVFAWPDIRHLAPTLPNEGSQRRPERRCRLSTATG